MSPLVDGIHGRHSALVGFDDRLGVGLGWPNGADCRRRQRGAGLGSRTREWESAAEHARQIAVVPGKPPGSYLARATIAAAIASL